jgi:hypothetical protein
VRVIFANATVGAALRISLVSKQRGLLVTCNNIIITAPNHNVWCNISQTMGPGSYFFEVSVEGNLKASYPFTVGAASMQLPDTKSELPKAVTFTCVKSNNDSVHATFVVDYARSTVVSPNFGAIGQTLDATISPTIISWHAREIRNYRFGGFNNQDMSIDIASGQLTDNFGDGIAIFNCHST